MWRQLASIRKVIFAGEILPDPERRELLRVSAKLIWAGIAAMAATAVGASFLRTPRRTTKTTEVRVADLSELQEQPQLFHAAFKETAGWRQVQKRVIVFARKTSGGEVALLSPVCSHLSCLVRWNDDGREFHCPCHNGRFSIEGRPLSGPPRQPLQRPPFEIRQGAVYLKVSE